MKYKYGPKLERLLKKTPKIGNEPVTIVIKKRRVKGIEVLELEDKKNV